MVYLRDSFHDQFEGETKEGEKRLFKNIIAMLITQCTADAQCLQHNA